MKKQKKYGRPMAGRNYNVSKNRTATINMT